MKSRIQARIEFRAELIDSIREYPDNKDYANRDRKAFKQDVAEAKASITELQNSIKKWTSEIKVLHLELRFAERMSS